MLPWVVHWYCRLQKLRVLTVQIYGFNGHFILTRGRGSPVRVENQRLAAVSPLIEFWECPINSRAEIGQARRSFRQNTPTLSDLNSCSRFEKCGQ